MSKTHTHTPGPWELQREDGTIYVQATYAGDGVTTQGGTYTICQLAVGFGVSGTSVEADATARLIAAAPELLAFVQEVARCGYTVNRDAAVQITNDARALIARLEAGA